MVKVFCLYRPLLVASISGAVNNFGLPGALDGSGKLGPRMRRGRPEKTQCKLLLHMQQRFAHSEVV
jgi:hypothetical protein